MNPANYDITAVGPTGDAFSQTIAIGGSASFSGLISGQWTITAVARNVSGTQIGSGSATTTVRSGQTTNLSLTVQPIVGNGTLDLSLTWPAANVTEPSVSARLVSAAGTTRIPVFDVNETDGTATYSVADIASGYYALSLQLFDNTTAVAGAAESVRIVAAQTTSGAINFTSANASGNLSVSITTNMASPLTVVIAGAEAGTKTVADSLSLSVDNDEGVDANYTWYVNGVSQGTGSMYTFGTGWSVGYYRIDAIAFSLDDSRAGSATAAITVTN